MRRVAIACCLLLLVMAGVSLAAPVPAGEKDTFEPEWHLDLSGLRAIVPEVEPNNSCTAPQAVNCGDVVDPAAINVAAEYDYYSFYVTAGTPITVGTDLASGCTTSIDTYIYLYNTSCTQVAYDDDSGPGAYSLISNYTALQTGTYVLGVRHYSSSGTGCYKAFINCTPPATGACCRAGGVCEILTASACATALGTYMGDNTSCTPNPCPQPPVNDRCDGALPLDRCSNGVISGTMASAANDYTPGSGGCTGYSENGPDVTYVLNLQVGDILTVSYDTPSYDGAIYLVTDCANAATTCVIGEDDPEPETFTYTVTTAGTFYLIADAYTSSTSGTFTLTWSVACPLQTGACCFPDCSCQVLTEDECLASGGNPMGVETACEPNPCSCPTGACCFPEGSCVLTVEFACIASGGSWQGIFTVCEPNPCIPVPLAACCFTDCHCEIHNQSDCEAAGGVYFPEWTSCDPNPCDCPPPPMGACCFADGTCQWLLDYDCYGAGGDFQGVGTWCDPNPCEPVPVEETTWGKIKSQYR